MSTGVIVVERSTDQCGKLCYPFIAALTVLILLVVTIIVFAVLHWLKPKQRGICKYIV